MIPSRSQIMSTLRNRAVFYTQAIRAAGQVGAFTYTSKPVADAVVVPIALSSRNGKPLRVLEVGAGTGALTRAIIERLKPGDRLDAYEINREYAKVLREELGGRRAGGVDVHIHHADITTLDEPGARYDRIVSTLPLLNMTPEKVRAIFDLLMARLEPGGTLSYYDYWAK